MSVGARIRTLRAAFKLSQRELAQILDIRQATASGWETDTHMPTKGNLRLVADLAENDRTVFSWLQDGGAKPNLKRHQPVSRVEPETSFAAIPPHLADDVDHWLQRQSVSLSLVEEVKSSLEEAGPEVENLRRSLESTLMALRASQLTMETVHSTLASEPDAAPPTAGLP